MIILFGIYHQYISISSDTTTTLPMSLDLLKGNILLKDWVLGTNNFYFTEIVVYAIGKMLGFSNITLIYWIPGIAWTVLFLCTLKFVEIEKMQRGEMVFFIIAEICLVLIVAPTAAYTLLNANSHNNLYAFLAIYLLLISKYIDKKRTIYLIVSTVLGIALSFSEGVTTMVLIAPMACVCLLQLINKEKQYFALLGSLILTYIGGKGIFVIFDFLGGMETKGLPIGLADFNEIPTRLVEWINQFSVLLGLGTYFNETWNTKKIFATILMIVFVIAIIYYCIKVFKISWKKQFLLMATVINLAACVFTGVVCFHRYVVIGYYFGYILVGLFVLEILRHFNVKKKQIMIVSVGLFILLFASLKLNDIFQQEKKNIDTKELANVIIEKELGNGYADFWCASVISFYTEYDNRIFPVFIGDETGIVRYWELIRRSWYDEKDIHYIITYADSSSIFIDTSTMLELCGEPDEIYSVGQYVLYYWDEDISDYLVNGLDDMRLLPYELSHNEYVEMSDGKEILFPNAIVYGPYDDIEAGVYEVTYLGEGNLDSLIFDVWSGANNKYYEISIVEQTETTIVYMVSITENVSDIEFRLYNNSDEKASYSSVTIIKKGEINDGQNSSINPLLQ